MIRFYIVAVLALCSPFWVLAESVSSFTLPSSVNVTIIEAVFDKKNADIEYCSSGGSICRINGGIPFGVDANIPENYVKKITVVFQDRSYVLDATGMYNAWGGRPLEYPGIIRYFGGRCFDELNCHFRGVFSDAAGSFAAEWIVVEGFSFRTVLTGSRDVVSAFLKNIDLPEYE